ncbi:MBL fold metallo-hydrolase [Candidatus Sumerlaeota bacterium]|nr:MBL fold metallo-hydrolase [Candidatus Sumerlaeota bacterium]
MGLCFQTLQSGSSGNVLMVWSHKTRVMIDCGVRSQKQLRVLLMQHAIPKLAALVNTHLHSDHINYHALRVMESDQTPVYVHRDNRRRLLFKHGRGASFRGLDLREYGEGPLEIGDLILQNFEIEHADESRNCGFVIQWKEDPAERIVIATDFFEWENIGRHFVDARIIYVEANHCPELLRRYPNFNSHFHLSNPKTGMLLAQALQSSNHAPRAIVLGHLSTERNRPDVALKAVRNTLKQHGARLESPLEVAPRFEPSAVYRTKLALEESRSTQPAWNVELEGIDIQQPEFF